MHSKKRQQNYAFVDENDTQSGVHDLVGDVVRDVHDGVVLHLQVGQREVVNLQKVLNVQNCKLMYYYFHWRRGYGQLLSGMFEMGLYK